MGVLEALSCGLPCLVTEGASLAKKIEAAGAGWNGGNSAESIASALREAVENRGNFERISAEALRLSEEYSWDNAAKTAVKHYRECLKER